MYHEIVSISMPATMTSTQKTIKAKVKEKPN
jgi:hypothetical protein